MLDEHLPHRACRDAEEVRAVDRVHGAAGRQLQIRLVDEPGGVERARPVLARELPPRQATQGVVDDGQQSIERARLAAAKGAEQRGHVRAGLRLVSGLTSTGVSHRRYCARIVRRRPGRGG